MQTTGIVRKIDELGRIVLPKELRKYLNINPGDDFQITVNDEIIMLEKYSRLNTFYEDIKIIIDCFSSVCNYKIYIIINDKIDNNVIIENNISKIIQDRKIFINENYGLLKISQNHQEEGKYVIFPIVINSDLLGAIIVIGNNQTKELVNTSKIINNIIKAFLLNN